MSGLNEKQLHLLLEEHYGCTNLGRCYPRPYCSEDDMPSVWKTSDGYQFTVPNPPNGSYYQDDHIELIIEVAKLEVVTSISAKRKSVVDVIQQFKQR